MIGIYKITNDVNGKIYVGKSINISKRWSQHRQASTDMPIHYAIRKYGIDHFHFYILEECDETILDEREQFWINELNSYYDGYNCTLGGEGASHPVKLSDEQVNQIIELLKQTVPVDVIANKFDVSKNTIYSINNGTSRIRNDINYPIATYDAGCFRTKHSKEEIEDLLIKYHGSFKDVADFYHVSEQTIRLFCKYHNMPTCAIYYKPNSSDFDVETRQVSNILINNELNGIRRIIGKMNSKHQPIDMCDINTHDIICSFWSIRDAAKYVKCNPNSIAKALKNDHHISKGFYWQKSLISDDELITLL